MKKIKGFIALLLAAVTVFSLSLVALCGKKEEKSTVTFSKEDACQVALTAAKSKILLDGNTSETAEKAVITKMKYNEDNNTVDVTVRAAHRYKYTCNIVIKTAFGAQIGYIGKNEYKRTNVISGFFGQLFEKIAYKFIQLFHKDEWQ